MNLATVSEQFANFCLDRSNPEEFVATFIAPNLEWLQDWDSLRKNGSLPTDSNLISRFITPRLNWEVINEFGFGSRIGRTLERTKGAIAAPDNEAVKQAVNKSHKQLIEEVESLRSVKPNSVKKFILGLLWRLRTRGAFDYDALDAFKKRRGDRFMLNRIRYMPTFGPNARVPTFLSTRKIGQIFDHLEAKNGWYANWLNKTLTPNNPLDSAEVKQAYSIALRELATAGLTSHIDVQGTTLWSLNPTKWVCYTEVADLGCDSCRHTIQVWSRQLSDWQGVSCQRPSCIGHYTRATEAEAISSLRNKPKRLMTSEHTGLLPPDLRLETETSFKDGDKPWDINLLSATPTLEMGIDIGDLSSVLLCSVPPSQTNYLQRIGRAGRKDGNALNVTLANGVPHDLYFYSDPEEIMAGTVTPPGFFLNASAVLERQLIAYCFDRWTATGITEKAIPTNLRAVLNALDKNDSQAFPYNFIQFIEGNASNLFKDFVALFDRLESDTYEYLKKFISGHDREVSISFRLVSRLTELQEERKLPA